MSITRNGSRRVSSTARYRLGVLLASTVTVVLGGCGGDTAIAPPTGVFPLRAVRIDGPAIVAVPASVARYAGDTIRYVGGGFELGPGNQWRQRWERVLVYGGVEGEPRVFETRGVYQISEVSRGTLVLDLYPGQITPAVVSPTAVLHGDTLSHGPFIFVR